MSLGGIKAVIWADAVQVTVIMSTIILIIIVGTRNIGGVSEVWRITKAGQRGDLFILQSSPYTQFTLWTFLFGSSFNSVQYFNSNQMFYQRFLSSKTLKKTQITFVGSVFSNTVARLLIGYAGILTYARFYDCDPLLNGEISARDQVVVLWALEVLSRYHGLTGLFIATILCASISTLSSTLNTVAGITIADHIKLCKPHLSDKTVLKISKLITILYGILAMMLVYPIQSAGNIFKAIQIISSATGAPLFLLFFCGMTIPWMKAKGAFVGMLIGMTVIIWASIGNMLYGAGVPNAPLSTDGCNATSANATRYIMSSNISSSLSNPTDDSFLQQFYLMPYLWYSSCCLAAGMLAAILATIITGPQNPQDIDPRLIFPFVFKICRLFPHKVQNFLMIKPEDNYINQQPCTTNSETENDML